MKCDCIKCGCEIDYDPQMCCNGRDCGCYGLPIDPQLCNKCYELIINGKNEELSDT